MASTHDPIFLSVVDPAARCRAVGRMLHRLQNSRRLGIFPRVVQSFFLPIVPALRRAACAVPCRLRCRGWMVIQ